MAQGGKTPAGKSKVAVEMGEVCRSQSSLWAACQLAPLPADDVRRIAPPTQANARSRGYNIFPFKSRESLLPLIDALDKMGELGKCAHPGGQGQLKKGQFSLTVRGSTGKPSASSNSGPLTHKCTRPSAHWWLSTTSLTPNGCYPPDSADILRSSSTT